MNKLLCVGYTRVRKDKMFYIGIVVMLLLGILLPILRYIDKRQLGIDNGFDSSFFSYSIIIVIAMSIFTSLYLGVEYGDGTIRNKLIVGHKRVDIYLSNFVINIVVTFIFQLAYIIPALLIGLPAIGFNMSVPRLVVTMICIFAMTVAFVSIFNLVGMLCQNKAITVVICTLCMIGLIFQGAYIKSSLSEPKMYRDYNYIESTGIVEEGEEKPNPIYVKGIKRDIYEFLVEFLPGGQAIKLVELQDVHPIRYSVYSIIVVILTTVAGVFVFRVKDIN